MWCTVIDHLPPPLQSYVRGTNHPADPAVKLQDPEGRALLLMVLLVSHPAVGSSCGSVWSGIHTHGRAGGQAYALSLSLSHTHTHTHTLSLSLCLCLCLSVSVSLSLSLSLQPCSACSSVHNSMKSSAHNLLLRLRLFVYLSHLRVSWLVWASCCA